MWVVHQVCRKRASTLRTVMTAVAPCTGWSREGKDSRRRLGNPKEVKAMGQDDAIQPPFCCLSHPLPLDFGHFPKLLILHFVDACFSKTTECQEIALQWIHRKRLPHRVWTEAQEALPDELSHSHADNDLRNERMLASTVYDGVTGMLGDADGDVVSSSLDTFHIDTSTYNDIYIYIYIHWSYSNYLYLLMLFLCPRSGGPVSSTQPALSPGPPETRAPAQPTGETAEAQAQHLQNWFTNSTYRS